MVRRNNVSVKKCTHRQAIGRLHCLCQGGWEQDCLATRLNTLPVSLPAPARSAAATVWLRREPAITVRTATTASVYTVRLPAPDCSATAAVWLRRTPAGTGLLSDYS